MKRSKKLIALLLVLALLVGVTVALQAMNLNGTDSAEETTEAETGNIILSLDADDITALSWDYSEYVSFERNADGDWVYTEDEAFPLDSTYLDAMLTSLSAVSAYRTIENVTDWDQYGLAVPICTVTVTAGETYTLGIGKESALGGQRYFSMGDGKVYLVDAAIMNSFCYGLYDVLAMETIPAMTTVTEFTVESENQSYTIRYDDNSELAYSKHYVWFMEDTMLDTEETGSLISQVTGLTWNSCADFNAADLSVYGLDHPAATVTVGYLEPEDSKEAFITLELGNVDGDVCYVRFTGSNMVYTADADLLDTLLYTTRNELLPDEVAAMDWDWVIGLDVTIDGETYSIERTSEETIDSNGNVTKQSVFRFRDSEVEAQDVLDAIDAVESNGYATGLVPEGAAEIQIVIHQATDYFPEVELVFYRYDSASCLTTLNGETTVLADRTQVAELVDTVMSLIP